MAVSLRQLAQALVVIFVLGGLFLVFHLPEAPELRYPKIFDPSLGQLSFRQPNVFSVSVPSKAFAGRSLGISHAAWNLRENAVFVFSLKKGSDSLEERVPLTIPGGEGRLELHIPESFASGAYEFQALLEDERGGELFKRTSTVTVRPPPMALLLETDKPYYKPGQRVLIRLLALDDQLRPREGQPVTLEIEDAKGFRVGRFHLTSDEFGYASQELPLSAEPNLGSWILSATSGEAGISKSFQVDKYVLPKFEVRVSLSKEANSPAERVIFGTVSATYSYGKPVKGTLFISLLKYGNVLESKELSLQGSTSFDFTLGGSGLVPNSFHEDGNGLEISARVTEEEDGEVQETKIAVPPRPSSDRRFEVEAQTISPGLPTWFRIKGFEGEQPLNGLVLVRPQIQREGNAHSPSFEPWEPEPEPDFAAADMPAIHPRGKRGRPHRGPGRPHLGGSNPPQPGDEGSLTLEMKNGVASLVMEVPLDASHLTLYLDQSSFYFSVAKSPLKQYLSLIPGFVAQPSAGDTLHFKVHSTNGFSPSQRHPMLYQVFANGELIEADRVPDSAEVSIKADIRMAPKARLVVSTYSGDSLVASQFDFELEGGLPDQVKTSFSTSSTTPMAQVKVEAQSSPNSRIGIVAIDKSLSFLGSPSQFLREEALANQPKLGDIIPNEGLGGRPSPAQMFSGAGITLMTNLRVPREEFRAKMMPMVAFKGAGAPEMEAMPAMMMDDALMDSEESDQGGEDATPVRSFFPETWVWTMAQGDREGKATWDLRVPDSITSWTLHSFSLSKERGLGIGKPEELTVLKSLFVSLDLPYSCTLGETLVVKLALYNYSPQDLEVSASLDRSEDFEVIKSPSDDGRALQVPKEGMRVIQYHVLPKKLGVLSLTARTKGQGFQDAVQKTLIVEAPGIEKSVSQGSLVSHKTHDKSQLSFSLPAPREHVPNSERSLITLNGDLMGPTLKGLDKLLQMPCGCGEQNMLNFAPDVFVTQYLEKTKQAKPEIKSKALSLMLTGYQRELTFSLTDGSFSAFGQSDGIGSMWLTAFVLKTFAKAKKFIYIDERVITQAISWILSHQESSGHFPMVGRVIHSEDLMGGSKSDLANSAFVTVALLEASPNSKEVLKSVQHLESQDPKALDSYTLAIVSYALSLAQSPKLPTFLAQLKGTASMDDAETLAFWGAKSLLSKDMTMSYSPGSVTTREIETTAYALLAFIQAQEIVYSRKIAKWLMEQRTLSGGFLSTQDTCVGLQALSAFVEATYSVQVELDVRIRHSKVKDFSHELRIDATNFDLQHEIEVPFGGETLVTVEGEGSLLVQAQARYNIMQDEDGGAKTFGLTVEATPPQAQKEGSGGQIQFKACVELLEKQTPGMTLLEVGLPTGYEASSPELAKLISQHEVVKRQEVKDRKVILYLNELKHSNPYCFEFGAKQTETALDLQPSTSTVFSYYSPHKRSSVITEW